MLHGPEGCARVSPSTNGLAAVGSRFEVVQAHLSAILNCSIVGCAPLSCLVRAARRNICFGEFEALGKTEPSITIDTVSMGLL